MTDDKTGVWVSQVGEIIIARIRGDFSKNLLVKLSHEISQIVQTSKVSNLLIDALEMNTPDLEVPMLQWKINEEQKNLKLRRAIVVPDTKLAYLARMAFGEATHKIFYNDLASAINWLTESSGKTYS